MRTAGVLLLLAALAACSDSGQGVAAPGVSLVKDFSVAESDAVSSHWRLDAESAVLLEKEGLMRFIAPRIKFYDADRVTSEIISKFGLMRTREKYAELNGDVVVNSAKDGMKLKTTKLYYSSARGKIWTEEPVTIYKDRAVTKGRGFTANPDLSEIEIEHQETRMNGK